MSAHSLARLTRGHGASGLMGFALGGLLDGIALHQLLQWHHVVSNRVTDATLAGLELNTFVDGAFHQAMWILAVLGIALLHRQRCSDRTDRRPDILPGLLIGWGTFNLVDALVMHWTLGLHSIRPGSDWLIYDAVFAGAGAIGISLGLLRGRTKVESETDV